MINRLTFIEAIEYINTITGCKADFEKDWFEVHYKNSRSKLPFTCDCGEPFERDFSGLKKKSEHVCKKCSNLKISNSFKSSYEDVESYINETSCKMKFDKEWFEHNYEGNKTKLPLICECGEDFQKSLAHFKRGQHTCNKCSVINQGKKGRNTYEEIIKEFDVKLVKINFDKDWFEVNYKGTNSTKFPLICLCGNPFSVKIGHFKSGQTICRECSKKNRDEKVKISFDELTDYISKTTCKFNFDQEWYDANYENIETKLPLICKCGTPFLKSYSNLSNRKQHNCRKCGKKRQVDKARKTYKEVIDCFVGTACTPDFNEIWFNQNYENNLSKIPVICECGQRYEPIFANFKKGQYHCPECAIKNMAEKRKKTYEEVLSAIAPLRCTPNFDKSWFTIHFKNTNETKLPLLCECGNSFKTNYKSLTMQIQDRCAICSRSVSKAEMLGKELLDSLNILHFSQFTFEDCKHQKVLPFDEAIFDPNKSDKPSLLIEFDGMQHFEPVQFGGMTFEKAQEEFKKTKERDEIKNQYCEKNDIPLLRIDCRKKIGKKEKKRIENEIIKTLLNNNLIKNEYLSFKKTG